MKRTQATPRERHIQAGVDRSADIRIGRLEAWNVLMWRRPEHPDWRARRRWQLRYGRLCAADPDEGPGSLPDWRARRRRRARSTQLWDKQRRGT